MSKQQKTGTRAFSDLRISHRKISWVAVAAILLSSCGIYKFNDASIPPELKTVNVKYIENKARYVNPQLSPALTDRLKQKITSQTKIMVTNNEDADWEIACEITDYSFSTATISQQQSTGNRLTVGVKINVYKRKEDESKDYSASRNYDFSASSTIQQAENSIYNDLLRDLTDDIFNRIFSDW